MWRSCCLDYDCYLASSCCRSGATTFASYDIVDVSSEAMGLRENLPMGLYAYVMDVGETVELLLQRGDQADLQYRWEHVSETSNKDREAWVNTRKKVDFEDLLNLFGWMFLLNVI